MNILALDSAGKTAGAALWQDGALLYENYLAAAGTHSETLMRLADEALRAGGLTCAQVDVFAANAGPGSFTGLRIGLAAVKGLAFSHNTPCAGVSTLEALAHTWPADGMVACALDARRSQVYCALFRRVNGVVERLTPDGALSAEAFSAQLSAYGAPIIAMGDGGHLLTGACVTLAPQPLRYGRAYGICLAAQQAVLRGECIPGEQLLPEYHRLSQAERERAEKLAKQQKVSEQA